MIFPAQIRRSVVMAACLFIATVGGLTACSSSDNSDEPDPTEVETSTTELSGTQRNTEDNGGATDEGPSVTIPNTVPDIQTYEPSIPSETAEPTN